MSLLNVNYPINKSWRLIFFILVGFGGCHSPGKKPIVPKKDTSRNSINKVDTLALNRPVFGYRFIVTGDFDGDGHKEKLIEHYYSGVQNRETNKFYDNLNEYDQLVEATAKVKTFSFITSDNKNIDTLPISSEGKSFGLAYLKNEGDLNGDGTDEISYVVNWADWSNLNAWHIMTYKNKRWRELYHFSIWDWQLPDLPGVINDYSVFGRQNEIAYSKNDSVTKALEKDLADFKGLVKKLGSNKIRIIFMNENANLDTSIIRLKNLKTTR